MKVAKKLVLRPQTIQVLVNTKGTEWGHSSSFHTASCRTSDQQLKNDIRKL